MSQIGENPVMESSSNNWIEHLTNLATTHLTTQNIIIVISSFVIVFLIWYLYNKQTGGKSDESYESSLFESDTYTSESLNGGEALPKCTLYYANWCGHCKIFKPTWHKLTKLNKYKDKVQFEEVEADENPEKIQTDQIQGFPTIKIKKNTEEIDYEGTRTIEDLEKFLDNNI